MHKANVFLNLCHPAVASSSPCRDPSFNPANTASNDQTTSIPSTSCVRSLESQALYFHFLPIEYGTMATSALWLLLLLILPVAIIAIWLYLRLTGTTNAWRQSQQPEVELVQRPEPPSIRIEAENESGLVYLMPYGGTLSEDSGSNDLPQLGERRRLKPFLSWSKSEASDEPTTNTWRGGIAPKPVPKPVSMHNSRKSECNILISCVGYRATYNMSKAYRCGDLG